MKPTRQFESPTVPHPVVYAGADGCKQGRWVAFLADDQLRCTPAVFDDLPSMFQACGSARRILIDVPIGLHDARRTCDIDAKRVLSRHNSRVFLSPIRAAVAAVNWEEANRISRAITDSGLSKQAWAIVPRIRRTDEFMRSVPAARAIIRECHPEICFWGLAGRPLAANKKSSDGLEARLVLLEKIVPSARDLISQALGRWPRSILAADDAVDALVAVVSAAAPEHLLRTLPAVPPRDAFGLPMEMVYRLAESRPSA